MAKMKRYATVDQFVASREVWQPEIKKVRGILLSTGMEEAIKWSFPCYVHNGRNVAGLGGFKSYFGIWFYDGNLLADPDGVLVNAQEGKTKSMRQWRMTSAKDIKVRKIKRYLIEAMAVSEQIAKAKKTKKTKPRKTAHAKSVTVPPELAAALKADARAKKGFGSLTPARQRDYAQYISGAKREATKARRLATIMPMLREGVGLDCLYRKK